MRTPTLDECLFHAGKIGLVPIEAEKFFWYFESNGWKVGKNDMKSWHAAMMTWKLRCQCQALPQTKGIDKVIMLRELEDVEVKMRSLRNSYDAHQVWAKEDQIKFSNLHNRRLELRNLLGMKT